MQAQGSVDEALVYYLKLLELYPESAQGHNSIGVAFMVKGKLDEAIGHFREALRIKPDHVNARYNLTHALELQKTGKR